MGATALALLGGTTTNRTRRLVPCTARDSVGRLERESEPKRCPTLARRPAADDIASNFEHSRDIGERQIPILHNASEKLRAPGVVGPNESIGLVHRPGPCRQMTALSSGSDAFDVAQALPFDNTASMTFAERLKKAREHAQLSQRQLSAKCSELGHALSSGHVGKLEIGERSNPRAQDVMVLARACGVRHEWLLDGTGGMALDVESEVDEVGAYDAARAMFLAQEVHEGRGEEARTFLATRSATYAGAEGRSPGWWLETLRDEFRTWRAPSKALGSRELEADEDARPAKTNARRAR
jgi:transcriptional regulator with XRE-family HTH domain